MARGRVLVDGFHRWQAHKKENAAEIQAIDLGDLLPIEILKESIRRNASHGRQLDTNDKRRMADKLYREGVHDNDELMTLLSITADTLEKYLREAKRDEKEANKAKAWDLWLDCLSYRQIGEEMEVDHKTVADWCGEKSDEYENSAPHATRENPWGVIQHFDVWPFASSGTESSYFGKMPLAVVENLLWAFTEPGDIVVDPFAGGGTTIDGAKAMGRCVWASDAFGTVWRSVGKRYGRCGLSAS